MLCWLNTDSLNPKRNNSYSRYTSAKFLLMWFMVFSLFWLLLNVVDNDNNYLNVTHLLGYFQKVTWYIVYTSNCYFSLFFKWQNPCTWNLHVTSKNFQCFFLCVIVFLFFLFLICKLISPLFKVLLLPRLA